MQPIDEAEFLQRLSDLLESVPDDGKEQQSLNEDSYLREAEPLLNKSTRNFAQIYGAKDALLIGLARSADAQGKEALAKMLRDLDAGIKNGTLNPPTRAKPAPRLISYVYPVV